MATAGTATPLQPPVNIRNVCILAHVDHGKTSLSDRLLSINGLISEASAGKVRYLDSREDEQRRQITIKASVVSLYFRRSAASATGASVTAGKTCEPSSDPSSSPVNSAGDPPHCAQAPTDTNRRENANSEAETGDTSSSRGYTAAGQGGYIVNLVDCPGHVDFASEVSAAVRLCDGGLLLVDAIEGVGPQTLAALQQAWSERVVPLLVLTKMDKLIQKLCLTPAEAYAHCQGIVEQVNAHLHQQIHSELLAGASWPRDAPSEAEPAHRQLLKKRDDAKKNSPCESGRPARVDHSTGEIVYFSGDVEQKLEFCPSRGNVLFISSLHGWCLHLPTFAEQNLLRLLRLPLSCLPRLLPALWGDYYLKRSAKQPQEGTNPDDLRPPGSPCAASSSAKPGRTDSSRFEVRKAPTHPRQPRIVEQLIFGNIWKMYEAAFASVESSSTPSPTGFPDRVSLEKPLSTQRSDDTNQTAPVVHRPANSGKLERLVRMVDALELPHSRSKGWVKQEITHLVRLQQEHSQHARAGAKNADSGGSGAGKGEDETGEEIVKAIMSRWLPVADIVLGVIVDRIPNPLSAARERLSYLCPALQRTLHDALATQLLRLHRKNAFQTLPKASSPPAQALEARPGRPDTQLSDEAGEQQVSAGVAGIPGSAEASARPPLVLLYVAKFLGADRKLRRLTGDRLQGTERFSGFVGLCRVFVGTLWRGAALYVCTEDRSAASLEEDRACGPLRETGKAGNVLVAKSEAPSMSKRPEKRVLAGADQERRQREVLYVRQIYMLCGQDMTAIDSAPVGSVVAVSLSRSQRRGLMPVPACPGIERMGEQSPTISTSVDRLTQEEGRPRIDEGSGVTSLSGTHPGEAAVFPDSGGDLSEDEAKGGQESEDALRDVTAWLQSLRDRNRPLLLQHQQREDGKQRGVFGAACRGVRGELTSLHRCLTLSNWADCPALITPYSKAASAIVRVAVEPQRLEDAQQFLKGMARLYVADPSIELSVLDSGEFLLGCCGEVHLETCVRDLQGIYAQVPITVSSPMVAIRETLAPSVTPDGLFFASPAPGFTSSPARTAAQFSPVCQRVAFPPWAKATAPCTSAPLSSRGLFTDFPGVESGISGTAVGEHRVFDADQPQQRRLGELLPIVQEREKIGERPEDELKDSGAMESSATRGGMQHGIVRCGVGGETSKTDEESIVTWLSRQAELLQGVCGWTASQELAVLLRAEPMPAQVTDWLTDASREINAVLKSRVPSRRFLPTSVSQSPSSSCPPETLGFSDARASELMRLLRTAIERIVSEIRSEWLQRDSLREASVAASLRSQNDTSSAGSPRDSADGARSENIRSSNVLPGSPSTAPVAEEMDLPNCNRCPGNAHGRVAFPGHLWGLALTGGACNAFFGAPSCRLIFQGVPSLPTNSTDRQEADTQIGNEKNAPLICAPTTVGERRTGVGRLPPGWQEVEGLHQWSLAHSYGADVFQLPSGPGGGLSSGAALLRRVLPALVSGFELASLSGPLAEEPVRGVAFIVEAIVYRGSHAASPGTSQRVTLPGGCSTEAWGHVEEDSSSTGLPETSSVCRSACSASSLPYGPFSGQVMSTMKETCRKALLQRGRCRIAEAMLRFSQQSASRTYLHELPVAIRTQPISIALTCEQRVLGKVYGVLSRRRSKILKEGLLEGQTSLFVVEGCLPTAEAVGIARDLRSKASGHASLQMQFSHWEVLDEDPFPEACMTEEEMEDEGEAGLAALASQITARRIINSIRKTKGLPTEEKLVEAAEKQRTLSKNK